MYNKAIRNMLKQIPTMISKILSQDKKTTQTIYINWWWVLYEKITKGIPTLRRQKISEKSQQKDDEIKNKLYTSNSNWNNWKFQIHWNKLEWVNPRSKIKRKQPYSVYSYFFY